MWSWVERWNTRRKLARGRCTSCRRILRDDETTGFCSEECALDWQDATAS